jgi:antitoxin MazE
MEVRMLAHIVKVGNSQGIRIPKALLEQTGLKGEVELRVEGHAIVVTAPTRHPRADWEEQFRLMHERGEDVVIETPASEFEATWEW